MNSSSSYQPRLVFCLSLAQLVTWGSVFYGFALLMEPVEQELGLSRGESSLAFSLALLAEGLLAYPIGRWIDRGHERVVMTCGSLLVFVCLVWHSFISSALGFYMVWLTLGAALAATLYTPAFAVVTRRFPGDFRRAIITLTFLGGLASTVFIPLTAWLIADFGWRHALWFLAALHLLLCAPLHALVLRDAPISVVPAGVSSHATPTQLAQHLRSAPFLLIGAFVVLLMAATSALPAHLVSLLRENKLPESWVIAIPASIGLMQVFGRAMLFFFERHFDLHVANRLIPCLIPLGFIVLLLTPYFGVGNHALVLSFVVLYGIGNGMLTIVKGTAIAQYVDLAQVAALNGALGVPIALARASAPLLMGVLWNQQVGYRDGLWAMLLMSIAGITCLIFAQRSARKTTLQ